MCDASRDAVTKMDSDNVVNKSSKKSDFSTFLNAHILLVSSVKRDCKRPKFKWSAYNGFEYYDTNSS